MSIETRELSTVDGVGRGPTARSISYAPGPYISATNVQAALDTLGVNYALVQSYAQSASASADTATSAASSAQGYATAAAASAGSAATQASSAAASAATATSQASAASASATSANSSQIAAEAAATASAGHAASAQASASASATSASDASGYASAASASASAAAGSASTASTAATNASNSATSAANSATSASGYATNASDSAATATTQATNAANSASAASTSATNAANSATSAQGYATAAATSESNASGYASAAAASAALAASYTLGWTGTSATSVLIATGSKSFTSSTGRVWAAGTPLLISSAANVNNFMLGVVTSYVSGTGALTVDVTFIGGSGTFSDWNISLSGQKGVDGEVLGPATNSDGWIPTWNGANSKTLANGIDPATLLTTAAAASGYQPLDSDLTAIAAVATTTYGRSLLALSDAANLASEVDPYFLTPAEGNAAYQPLDSDLTAIAALSTTAYGRALLTLASQAALIAEANGAASTSVIYVSKTGSDSNSGLYAGLPKLTIAAAITAAAALITGSVTAAVVSVLDSRQYTEDITLTAGVSLKAPLADLVGAIVVGAACNVELRDHFAAAGSTTMLTTADASGGASIYKSRVMDGRGTGGALTGVTLFENASSGRVLMGHIGMQMFVGSGGFGLRDNSGSGFGHIHIITPDLYLAGNSATAIRSNNVNTNIIGYIDRILEIGGGATGTTGIEIGASGGTVKITASEIIADTVYSINAAGTCYLQCPKQTGAFTGSLTNAGGWVPSAADRILYGTGANTTAETALTAFGRSLIDDADAATARSTLGLVIGTNVQAYDADLTTWAGLTPSANAQSLVTAADYAAMRTLLGLVIGTNVQAYDAELAAIAGLASAADRLPYFTGSGTASLATFTSAGRALVDDADAAAQRTTLWAGFGNWSVVYTNGTSVPTALAVGALGTILAGQGVSAAPAFTSAPQITTIELGHATDTTLARASTGDVSIEGNIVYRAGGTDVPVTDGGTGASDAATARTNLGLVIGTNVQAYDAELAAIAGLTSAADKLPYFTGSGTADLTDLSSFARTLLDDADAATARTTLGVTSIGARAYRSTTQTISGGGFTKLQFDAETYDTHGCYDSSTNYRFTPTVAGYYLVIIVVSTQAVGGQTPQLVIYKNGSRYSAGEYFAIDSIYCDLMTMDIVYLNGSTDYVEGYIWTADASYIDGGSDYDFISIARIGA